MGAPRRQFVLVIVIVAWLGLSGSLAEGAGLPELPVRTLAVDPTNSAVVYAGTSNGIYKTTDAGANWTRIDSGLLLSDVTALAIDPTAPCTIYAGFDSHVENDVIMTTHGPLVTVRNSEDTLAISTDCGGTWRRADFQPWVRRIERLAFTSEVPSVLFTSEVANQAIGAISYQKHRFARRVPGRIPQTPAVFDGSSFVFGPDPSAPCVIYLGDANGRVWRNSSCGDWNWTLVGRQLPMTSGLHGVSALAVDPVNSSTLLAATVLGTIFRITADDLDWRQTFAVGESIDAMVHAPGGRRVLYAAGRGGTIYQSPDGGATWDAAVSVGPPVSSLAIGATPVFRAYAAGNGFVVRFDCSAGCPFSDAALPPGAIVIKAQHIKELRERIDRLREAYIVPQYDWSDAVLVPGTTAVRALHLLELRAALAEVYAAAGRPAPTFTDPDLESGTVAKAIHLAELRNAVLALE